MSARTRRIWGAGVRSEGALDMARRW